jgi:hypothetical protein
VKSGARLVGREKKEDRALVRRSSSFKALRTRGISESLSQNSGGYCHESLFGETSRRGFFAGRSGDSSARCLFRPSAGVLFSGGFSAHGFAMGSSSTW